MMTPKSAMMAATPISTVRWDGPPASCVFSVTLHAPRTYGCRRQMAPPTALPGSITGQEARFLHQRLMALFFGFDPLCVVRPGHERLIEGTVLHQVLPLRSLTHLSEQVDVVVNLFFGSARRRKDAA